MAHHSALRRVLPRRRPTAPPSARRFLPLLLGLAAGSGSGPAFGVDPEGEFLVNTVTAYGQVRGDVAADSDGDFVVVWQSERSNGTDSDDQSIQGQLFDDQGAPIGAQFQVNTYTTHRQGYPSVAFDGLGRFVVVWAHRDLNAPFLWRIRGQRYDSAGSPLGGEFQVNSLTSGYPERPSVAADPAGNFVVAWSGASAESDNSGNSIQARRFNSAGVAQGNQFQVNSYAPSSQYQPEVASDLAGNFMIVWDSFSSPGTDSSVASVQGRRFAANGTPAGDQFQINTYTSGMQTSPAVASDGQGAFVVAWESNGSAGSDSSYTSIQAQRYAPNGSPVGGEVQVNSFTTSFQGDPSVAIDGDGNALIAWRSYGSFGGDVDGQSAQSQRYDADGDPLCSQIQLNQPYTQFDQRPTAVAVDGLGRYLVTWESLAFGGDNDRAIVALRAGPYAFCGDFESGTTGGWSGVVP